MTKLARYLKPFLWLLVLVLALLFVQALSDLYLPNYMSSIVNVGIQQRGIEHAAPEQISEAGMGFIQSFMTEQEKLLVGASYRLEDGRYVRSLQAGQAQEAVDRAFESAAFMLVRVVQDLGNQNGGAARSEAGAGIQTMDIGKLYALAPMLDSVPQAQLDAVRAEMDATPETMKKQYGILLCEAFYRELGVDLGALQQRYIRNIGLRMLGVALIGGIATVLVGLISARVSAGVAKRLRSDVFAKVESFSAGELNKFGTASLITRTTNDITQVQMLIQMGTRMVFYSPIMCVGGILMALSKSASMSWIIALAGIVLIGLIIVLFSIVMPKFKLIQKLIDKLNLVSREQLSGLMVIRAFSTQKHEQQRFDDANRQVTKVNLFINRVMTLMSPVMTLVMSGTMLLVMWVGAHQIASSGMQVGDMMAFMQYATQIIMSFLMLSMIFVFAPRAAVSANRIAEVLETEPSIVDPETPLAFDPALKGVVEFRDVHFKYEGAEEYALRDISFTALPGQTTAIIGSTGSGKSTIANLVLRFYDATEGDVRVSGVDVRDVTQAALRERIGYVQQKGVLLSGTIASNLRYGNREASDAEIREAAQVAQALDFIEEKPNGFDDAIAQGGTNVSGGQKQRLSIARALVKHPDIFIFDDSFSALDFKTDVALRKALLEYAKGSTVLIVAQRVSTIRNAEQIIVLDEGRIVGRGTHWELLRSCPEYQEIAYSQLAEEELR